MKLQHFFVFASAILLKKVWCECDARCYRQEERRADIMDVSWKHVVPNKNITIADKSYYFFPQHLKFEQAYLHCLYLGLDYGVVKSRQIAITLQNFIVQTHPGGKP